MNTSPLPEAPAISVVIPVYNSEQTLAAVAEGLSEIFMQRDMSWEAIFIDDGSRDQSWTVLQELQARYPENIVAIQLMRNFGQHNALMCGFHQVRGDIVITMDDDLQNPPGEIPKLIDTLQQGGFDLVYGNYGDKKHAAWRNAGSSLIQKFYSHVFKIDIAPTSFRAMRTELVRSILTYQLNYTYIDGLLNWSTQRIGSVQVRHEPRQAGRSGYRVFSLALLALNLFTNFSILPLQMISLLGFGVAGLGFCGALYYLIQYFLTSVVVPGFATIVIALLVIGGLQMLALGVIGEYLGRIHLNINRKPQFIVRQKVSSNTIEPSIPELASSTSLKATTPPSKVDSA